MKKIAILAVVLVLLTATSAFSLGLGGAFGLQPVGGLPGSQVMLSAKLDQLPFLMGLGFAIGQDVFQLGFTADWWMLQEPLINFIGIYVGPGLYVGVANSVQVGARVPVGLQVFPIDVLELFLEVAPTISAIFGDPIVFPDFALQASFGFRFWFN
jgi:hypothetical protein